MKAAPGSGSTASRTQVIMAHFGESQALSQNQRVAGGMIQ
jgi:hypothetical protein